MFRSLLPSAAVLRCVFLFSLASAALCGAPVEPFPGLDAKWKHAHSEHFEVFGRTSDSYVREILRNLETTRAAFLSTCELQADDSVPVTVYVFRSRRDMRAYTSEHYVANENLIGEYRPGFDRDVIMLDADLNAEASYWVIYADLTKNLLHGTGSRGPSWLFQGLSMLWGNFDARSGRSIAGRSDTLREQLVRENPTMDIEALFAVREGSVRLPELKKTQDKAQSTTNIFHAKAWVLLHYWYFGQKEIPATDVNRFVRFMLLSPAARNEERVRQEFERVFRVDYEEMNQRVGRYMRAGRFNTRGIEGLQVPKAESFTVRTLDAMEMRERLAELRLRTRRDDLSKFVLIDALRGERAARAAEALGTVAAELREDTQALDYWRRALEAGSTNLSVVELVLRLEFARRFGQRDFYYRLPAERAEELRALVARVRAQAPGNTEFLEMLAWIESAAPEPDVRNVNLVQAQLRSEQLRPNGLLAIALVRARLGERDSAIRLLAQIDSFGASRDEAAFAQQVRRILGDPALAVRE